jgi:hypothetical protein
MKSQIYRCNCRKTWSIQSRKQKLTVHSILLDGEWGTELKPERKNNPKGFVTTIESGDIILNPPKELLLNYSKISKLVYDKENVNFNMTRGKYLFFAEDGACYVLMKR